MIHFTFVSCFNVINTLTLCIFFIIKESLGSIYSICITYYFFNINYVPMWVILPTMHIQPPDALLKRSYAYIYRCVCVCLLKFLLLSVCGSHCLGWCRVCLLAEFKLWISFRDGKVGGFKVFSGNDVGLLLCDTLQAQSNHWNLTFFFCRCCIIAECGFVERRASLILGDPVQDWPLLF